MLSDPSSVTPRNLPNSSRPPRSPCGKEDRGGMDKIIIVAINARWSPTLRAACFIGTTTETRRPTGFCGSSTDRCILYPNSMACQMLAARYRPKFLDVSVVPWSVLDVVARKGRTRLTYRLYRRSFNSGCGVGAKALTDMGYVTSTGSESREADVLIQDQRGVENRVEYNWETEWYALYLAAEVPTDAPLGLTLFDKQLVLYKDGNGVFHCHEDRCPHRAAKLSEGQLTEGRLECLYHGWQFDGEGKCVKIPQLPHGAKIPHAACVRSYEARESQGVIWVWMGDRSTVDLQKIPWFEHYARAGFQDLSSMHELPYDHSILLENLMDPAHIPISHDRTDFSAKRENAQALVFEVTERTPRGFAGRWREASSPSFVNTLRFEAPCIIRSDKEYVDKDGNRQYVSTLFLCCPAGQGRSMLIVRFGGTQSNTLWKVIPGWVVHQISNKVFEQDMGFLSSQNAVLIRKQAPTCDLYLNLKSCDTWVTEYRKWLDRVGHGMPYYFGHRTFSLPRSPALLEAAPAGPLSARAASSPTKGASGSVHAPDPTNRYFRHVIHCNECRMALRTFENWKKILLALAYVCAGSAILVSRTQWRLFFLVSAVLSSAGVYASFRGVSWLTTNFVRQHRR